MAHCFVGQRGGNVNDDLAGSPWLCRSQLLDRNTSQGKARMFACAQVRGKYVCMRASEGCAQVRCAQVRGLPPLPLNKPQVADSSN